MCTSPNCKCSPEQLRIQLLQAQIGQYEQKEKARNRIFRLTINLENQFGARRHKMANSIDEAKQAANEIRSGTGYWAGSPFVAFQQNNRELLADKIMSIVRQAEARPTEDIYDDATIIG